MRHRKASVTAAVPAPPPYKARAHPLQATNTASEAAIPSMPSMKLNRLSVHTMASVPRTTPIQVKQSNPTPAATGPLFSQNTAHAAAATCTASRTFTETGWRSSRNPTRATAMPPPRSAVARWGWIICNTASARNAVPEAKTIAAPPPLGVGEEWELRSLGTVEHTGSNGVVEQ